MNTYLVIALILLLVAFLGRSRLGALRGARGAGAPAPSHEERHTAPLADHGRAAHLETAATRTMEPPTPLAAPLPAWSEPAIAEPAIAEPGWPMPGEIAGSSWAPQQPSAPEPAPLFEEPIAFVEAPAPAPAPAPSTPSPAPAPPVAVAPEPVPVAAEPAPDPRDDAGSSTIPVWQPPAQEPPALTWEHPVEAEAELPPADDAPALEWIAADEPAAPAEEVVAWMPPVEEPVAPAADPAPTAEEPVIAPLAEPEPEPIAIWTPPVAPEPAPEAAPVRTIAPEPAPSRPTVVLTALSDQEGVTPRMFAVMAALADGPLSVNDQATRHGVSRPLVAGLCGRLEALGLAEKIRDERDRRRVRVGLTEAGRRIIEAAAA